jgi:predicted aconitase with swiveling domain
MRKFLAVVVAGVMMSGCSISFRAPRAVVVSEPAVVVAQPSVIVARPFVRIAPHVVRHYRPAPVVHHHHSHYKYKYKHKYKKKVVKKRVIKKYKNSNHYYFR